LALSSIPQLGTGLTYVEVDGGDKVNYELSYFVYSLIFLLVWGILFALRKDLRRKMLLVSLSVSPMGPISEIWYLRDYWQRPTITGYAISIEDAIFAFAIGGITFTLYKTVSNMTIIPSEAWPRRNWLVGAFPLMVLAFLLIFTNWLRMNSILSSSFSFVLFAVLVWRLRPDLIKPSVISGILSLILFLLIYQLMRGMFPGVLLRWCIGCNPSGVRILGLNIEEMLWDFSWGLVGGIVYEAVTGKTFHKREKRGGSIGESQHLSDYSSFDLKLDKNHVDSLTSRFGRFMAFSAKYVLSIRIVRELSHRLSKAAGREMSGRWVILLLVLLSPLVNLLLCPFGRFCEGIAFFWLVYYTILNCCLLEFPRFAWLRLVRITDRIDDMLESAADKDKLIWWMKQRLRLYPQLLLSIGAGGAGLITLRIVAPFLAGKIQFCVASYLSVFITAALGANGVYWLWLVPFLIYRLHKFPSLRVTWNSPVRTPAIRDLSRLLGVSALLTSVGVILFVIPLLYVYFSVQSVQSLLFLNTVSFAASLGTLLFVTVFPQYWLSGIVYREKCKILDELSAEIDNHRGNGFADDTLPSLAAKINIYQAIDATSSSTIDAETLVKYTLAVLTIALPYIIQWLAQNRL